MKQWAKLCRDKFSKQKIPGEIERGRVDMFCVNIKQIEKIGGSVVHKNINFDTRSFTLIPIKIVYNF